MGAFFLIALVVIMVVNTLFTYWIWKGKFRMADKEMVIPRGESRDSGVKAQKSQQEVDYGAIAAMVNQAIEVDVDESGETETTVSPEEIAKITQSVLANMKA